MNIVIGALVIIAMLVGVSFIAASNALDWLSMPGSPIEGPMSDTVRTVVFTVMILVGAGAALAYVGRR